MQGVRCIAYSSPVAYFVAFVVYSLTTMLSRPVALAIAAVLPLLSFAAMQVALRGMAARGASFALEGRPERASFSAIPRDAWKFILALTIIYFANGVMRPASISWGGASLSLAPAAVTASTVLPSMVALICAYVLYRRNPLTALYIAFPLMAVFALLPPSWDPYSAGFTFCTALVSMELWFIIISSVIKDGVSAFLCVALLRCAQWTGGALGRIATPLLTTPKDVSIVVLLALVGTLLILVGFMTMSKLFNAELSVDDNADALADGRTPDAARRAHDAQPEEVETDLERHVRIAAERFKLSPREQEVLAIWATGHTSAYIESKLFISKNTVKTHLNHIYAKTATTNRESLLQLLETMD